MHCWCCGQGQGCGLGQGYWQTFADPHSSGFAKPSFILFVNQSEYDYVWNVEDDMFFTGPWSHVLDSVRTVTSDLVSLTTKSNNPNEPKIKRMVANNPHSSWLLEQAKTPKGLVKAWWPLLRISRRFVQRSLVPEVGRGRCHNHAATVAALTHRTPAAGVRREDPGAP